MNNITKRPLRSHRSGFTLIELMVVILIIGILSGIVLTAMNGGNEAGALDGAAGQTRSLFSLARSGAIARKVPMRVLIHADPDDEDRYLRFFTIVYQSAGADTPGDTTDDEWGPYTQGEFLPEGIYFSPAMSVQEGSDKNLKVWDISYNPTTVDFSSPGAISDATASRLTGTNDPVDDKGANTWFMYQFNSNGTFADPIARVVLTSALLVNDGLVFNADGPFQQAKGFVLFRSGKPMFFQDAEQMEGS